MACVLAVQSTEHVTWFSVRLPCSHSHTVVLRQAYTVCVLYTQREYLIVVGACIHHHVGSKNWFLFFLDEEISEPYMYLYRIKLLMFENKVILY